MTRAVLRLDADDVWRSLETIDPVAVLAEELIKRTIGHPDAEPARPLVPWADDGGDGEYVLSEDRSNDVSCAMPAASLRMVHAAALAALATRELLVPGGVTMAMLGTRAAIQSQLAVLARHVPDIVHVAVRITDKTESDRLEPRLIDQLDLAGIGLSVNTALTDTLFGANLVVTVSDEALTEGLDHATVGHLVRGTLLVNASGHDLPPTLLNHVDEIYVDDLALLPQHADRYIVAGRATRPNSSWRADDHAHPPAITADLGQLLAGACPGRERQDDIVVVELLSANAPDIHLAHTIAQTARRRGLGVRVPA